MTGARDSALLRSTFTTNAVGDTLTVAGELDASVADALLASILAERDSTDRHVDLSGVTFLDCAALRALIQARTKLAQENRRLCILKPSVTVVRLLDVTGLSEVLLERD